MMNPDEFQPEPTDNPAALPTETQALNEGHDNEGHDESHDESHDEAGEIEQAQKLRAELAELTRQRDQVRADLNQQQAAIQTVLEDSLSLLKQRQADLQRNIEQLERRRDAIRKEMRENFAGVSQDLALRIQGFKDYLVGSLQDLATTADQLNLVAEARPQPSLQDGPDGEQTRRAQASSPGSGERDSPGKAALPLPQFAQKTDAEQEQAIRELLERYHTAPDYYGPPWQLRRTFEAIHVERISRWFFDQGGRGSIKTLGSRLQNILVASAAVSVLNDFYGDRCCTLVLANSPERLGDWRRGLQECLGIARQDFGPSSGVVLCESPEVLAQRAERLLRDGDLPLIILDESEVFVDVALLRFPLWLAFSPDPAKPRFSDDEPFGPERVNARSEGGGLFDGGPNKLWGQALGSLGLGRDNGNGATDPRGDRGGSGRYDSRGYDGYGSGGYGSGGYGSDGSSGYGSDGYGSGGYRPDRYDAGTDDFESYGPGRNDAYGADPAYGSRSEYDSRPSSYSPEPYSDPYDDPGYGPSDYRQTPSGEYGSERDRSPSNDPYGDRYSEGGGGSDRTLDPPPSRRSRYSRNSERDRQADDLDDDWL